MKDQTMIGYDTRTCWCIFVCASFCSCHYAYVCVCVWCVLCLLRQCGPPKCARSRFPRCSWICLSISAFYNNPKSLSRLHVPMGCFNCVYFISCWHLFYLKLEITKKLKCQKHSLYRLLCFCYVYWKCLHVSLSYACETFPHYICSCLFPYFFSPLLTFSLIFFLTTIKHSLAMTHLISVNAVSSLIKIKLKSIAYKVYLFILVEKSVVLISLKCYCLEDSAFYKTWQSFLSLSVYLRLHACLCYVEWVVCLNELRPV